MYRAPGQELRGLDAIHALFGAYCSAFPDLQVEIANLLSAGNWAAVAFTLTGTHADDLLGIDATGTMVRVNGTVFSRFEDGKVIEEWEILDQLSLYEQLGVFPLPV